jgi:hypothetical protein
MRKRSGGEVEYFKNINQNTFETLHFKKESSIFLVWAFIRPERRICMTEVDYCKWDSSCGRKVRFSRAAHAQKRLRRILDSGIGFAVDTLAAYRCNFCLGFHIGNARCNQQAHNQWEGEL